tara:strand:+ start:660 stop:839 length:180 start_codon:yes stop_codon:yes gene_type:complete
VVAAMAVVVAVVFHQLMELQTQVVVAVAAIRVAVQVAQAVQALSFFATPAQFNISLVAQ